MSKSYMTRVAKYAAYRKQIEQSRLNVSSQETSTFEQPMQKVETKANLNTTTSLNADAILQEIEKRESPQNQELKDFERESKMIATNRTITWIIIGSVGLIVLTLIFILLYRSLS